MSKKKQVSIKLDVTGEGEFGRDTWYGWGPFKAKLDGDNLQLGLPDTDVQVCTPASNDYGTYYTFNIGGGKGFASVINHEKYGTYLRLRLGDKVTLPSTVVDKMNYKPKAAGGNAKPAGNDGFWS